MPAPPMRAVIPGIPILMHDQVIVAPGNEAPMSSKAFLNTRSKAVALRTLSITLAVTTAAAAGTTLYFLGGSVALQITLKKKSGKTFPLTRGYVPTWCFCRSDNRQTDMSGGVGTFTLTAEKWRFSSPIVLDPGDMLAVQVKHLGVVNYSVTADVSFAGSDTPVAGGRQLPYVAYWQSRDFAYAEVGGDSTPLDALMNDTGVDLHIDRIIGRFAAFDASPAAGVTQEFTDYADATDQAANYASVRVSLSQNRPIIRAYTGFRAAFGQEAAIETAFKLAPQDYIAADVWHIAGDVLIAPLTYFRGRAFLSLVGSREV